MTDQVLMAGGKASSSFVPPYHLIPTVALMALAMRFHLGIQKRPDGTAWNAESKNQEVLDDREFLINRIGHGIHHSLLLLEKLRSGDIAALEEDDDAAAILFAGAFSACAVARLIAKAKTDAGPNNAPPHDAGRDNCDAQVAPVSGARPWVGVPRGRNGG